MSTPHLNMSDSGVGGSSGAARPKVERIRYTNSDYQHRNFFSTMKQAPAQEFMESCFNTCRFKDATGRSLERDIFVVYEDDEEYQTLVELYPDGSTKVGGLWKIKAIPSEVTDTDLTRLISTDIANQRLFESDMTARLEKVSASDLKEIIRGLVDAVQGKSPDMAAKMAMSKCTVGGDWREREMATSYFWYILFNYGLTMRDVAGCVFGSKKDDVLKSSMTNATVVQIVMPCACVLGNVSPRFPAGGASKGALQLRNYIHGLCKIHDAQHWDFWLEKLMR